ncbi:hypothetical protein [Nocardioides pinisoli]|uniref:Uncharacterized protein n=1 Tax=Nocardioides pinisoli TaxID=2950279 RepID=A0ABT1KY88_9ACTN|nr:hypothetical protein [Nocardioides pinisoli]MCP3422730.1 hypothetical protein [Nocardioides pinisoli]
MDLDWDWQLFLEYLDVLAWPLVVVFMVVIFRGRLHELMGRITQAEGAGFKAQFTEARAKAEVLESAQDSAVVGELRGELPAITGTLEGTSEGPPEAPTSVATKRLGTTRMKAFDFGDLVDGFHLLEAYDEVVLDLSHMRSDISRSGAQMWGLGVEMGSRAGISMTQDDDRKLMTLSHANPSMTS